ncbi:tripartite tricarboxylate transporter substrate binding protein [Acidovorax sp. JG5]|jgi:tripartite-type tricarboxylate transporter receptor subunit TctC|uniref:tripartite tricarboxylate transporter substrate binding protein n=1 Tax=Acidovorax sp. JG5 TaxID=2822718 RepID=UPI001B32C42F|nr:tripartite tricarboxylate transporter substrate binding protein [Acidovorax sp. JG5]MBP3982665.1 tripartite tricarboxylate transporter substrate binding protein [Acidovorax sp. JG5]
MNRIPTMLRRSLAAMTLCATAIVPGLAHAAYPEQPIKMVVAYATGGGTDIIARLMAQYMQKHMGNNASIVVMNRPGAGGAIGFTEVVNAKPDGYTIGFINTPNVLTIPIERMVSFHWSNYDLLGNVVDDPGNFSVHADTPIKSLGELAAYAKANPGAVTYGTTGIGSDDHLAALMFERAAGVKLTHVPFKGGAEVHNAIASKQIFMAAMNIGEALQYQKGGTPLRHLGQMSDKRSNLAANVPTFKEQGFKVIMASLRGIAAPKGLPPAVREQLVNAVQKAVSDPEFQAKASNYFAPLRYLAPAAYAAELKEDEAEFQQLWQVMPWTDK